MGGLGGVVLTAKRKFTKKKVLSGETKSTAILKAMKHLLTCLILVSLLPSRGECRGGKSLERHDTAINYVNLVENQ